MTTRRRSASTRAASRSIVVLPTPGGPQQQHALAGFDEVLDDVDGAVDRAPHAAGQAHDNVAPVANGRDAMQRALHAGAVVGVEVAGHRVDGVDVRAHDFALQQTLLITGEARRGHAAEVEHDFDQFVGGFKAVEGLLQLRRQDFAQFVDVVGDAPFPGDGQSSLPNAPRGRSSSAGAAGGLIEPGSASRPRASGAKAG